MDDNAGNELADWGDLSAQLLSRLMKKCVQMISKFIVYLIFFKLAIKFSDNHKQETKFWLKNFNIFYC